MRKHKNLLSFLLIMSMLLINASMVKADDATSEYYERLMILQKPAAEASEVVYQYFLKAGIPEEFSGLWVEDTSLIIALTELGDDKTTFYRNLVGDILCDLSFRKADYSYETLATKGKEIIDYINAKDVTIYKAGVDQKANAFIVGVDSKDIDIVKSSDLEGMYGIRVNIMAESPCYERATNLYGGSRLYNSTTENSVTASGCGTYNGSQVLLTCGHGSQGQGDTIKYSTSYGSTIGTVQYRQYQNDYIGDYEFISINTSLFSSTSTILPSNSVIGSFANIAIGLTVKLYGSYTMSPNVYGEVTGQNLYINQTYSYYSIDGMSEVAIQSGSIQSGDSGAPVYYSGSGSNVYFCGVLNGSNSNHFYFTPYTYIHQAGFTIKTIYN